VSGMSAIGGAAKQFDDLSLDASSGEKGVLDPVLSLTSQLQDAIGEFLPKDPAGSDGDWAPVLTQLQTATTFASLHHATRSFARALSSALEIDQSWSRKILMRLAELSKTLPSSRQLFGPVNRVKVDEKSTESTPPDCILDLARQLLAYPAANSHQHKLNSVPAIRLIANCCADNNLNRSLIIRRGGLTLLRELAFHESHPSFNPTESLLALLLPAIYNVCADYDEPAPPPFDNAGADSKQEIPGELNVAPNLSLSELILGSYSHIDDGGPSVYMLLSLVHRCPKSQLDLLADLIEMSSRPFLVLGKPETMKQILGITPSSNSMAEVATRVDAVRDTLLFVDKYIASQSPDAQASMCQTWLNLLASQDMRRSVSGSPAIDSFVELPYVIPLEESDDVDLQPYKDAFLKATYMLSAEARYAEIAVSNSDLMKRLQTNLKTFSQSQPRRPDGKAATLWDESHDGSASSPMACVLVLINNALVDKSRVEAFVSRHQNVPPMVVSVMLDVGSESALLPAVKLASRVALITPGAEALINAAPTFQSISRVLGVTSPEAQAAAKAAGRPLKHALAIRHETIILCRQLVKASSSHDIASFVKTKAFVHIKSLSSASIDATCTFEVARLDVEILRKIASSSSSSSDSQMQRPAMASLNASDCDSIARSILFLLTDAPTPSAQSEALFGLGLFASLFLSSASSDHDREVEDMLLQAIEVKKDKVLPVMERICLGKGQGRGKADYENLKIFLFHIAMSSKMSADASTIKAGSRLREMAREMGLETSKIARVHSVSELVD
jgi:hypothetical protein